MRKYFDILNDEQLNFISNEFGISKQQLLSISNEQADTIYDEIGLMEADEIVLADDGPLSSRGEMASSIVTALGNALAEDEGWTDDE